MTEKHLAELKRMFGKMLSVFPETLERYSRDETSNLEAKPDAVVFAEETAFL